MVDENSSASYSSSCRQPNQTRHQPGRFCDVDMVASHQGVSDGVASDKAAVLPFYCTCYTVQYGTVLYSTMGKVLYCTVLYCKGKQDHEHLELPRRSVQRGGSLDTKGSRGHVTIYTIPRTNQEPLGNRLLRR